MKLPFVFSVACVLLTGCSTPYKSNGVMGGYSHTQLAPDVFRVSFQGNGYTSEERAQDFALLRTAELCLTNGYTCFAVINEQASQRTMAWSTPATSYTSGQVTTSGNRAYYNGTTTTSGGQTFMFYFPRSGVLVQCFVVKPEQPFTFDAAFLKESLQQKYFRKGYRPKS